VVSENDDKINKLTKNIIKVPKCNAFLSPIVNVIPLQLLAYYIADFKGINVDKPRNLAKSVTVE
jgi:glucosamine--fructose-6-phosphate aminotransferase (isomerizing)